MLQQILAPGVGGLDEQCADPESNLLPQWAADQIPLGFAAGDANLYRYVGNNPTNATDPSGLIPDAWDPVFPVPPRPRPRPAPFPAAGASPPAAATNVAGGNYSFGLLLNAMGVWTPTTKPTILANHPFPQANMPTAIPNPTGSGTNVLAGQHQFFPPGLGQPFVGTGGCAGCVGVIIQVPGHGTAVFHFNTGNNVLATLSQYTWPAGSHAVVFGGNNQPASNVLMQNVISALRPRGITLDGVLNSSNCYLGANGDLHTGLNQGGIDRP